MVGLGDLAVPVRSGDRGMWTLDRGCVVVSEGQWIRLVERGRGGLTGARCHGRRRAKAAWASSEPWSMRTGHWALGTGGVGDGQCVVRGSAWLRVRQQKVRESRDQGREIRVEGAARRTSRYGDGSA